MLTTKTTLELSPDPGPSWPSFEQFRQEGAKSLEPVRDNTVATLVTKTGQYRILPEEYFQHILGLAQDVRRVKEGLNVIILAARTVDESPNESAIETLLAAIGLVGQLPALPVLADHSSLKPEYFADSEEDEGLILDPAKLQDAIMGTNSQE